MLKLQFETGNAAFGDGFAREECARILLGLVQKLEQGSETRGGLYDSNGNRVGQWELTEST